MTDREFYLMVSRDMDVKSLAGCQKRRENETHDNSCSDRVYDASPAMEVA